VGLFEALMMGLRLVDGVDLEALAEDHGVDPRIVYAAPFEAACRDGLLVWEGVRLRPTERGLELLSSVLRELVPDAECAVERFEGAT
jgi:oxygen-independent coproporphyrinogen-3 oxidase